MTTRNFNYTGRMLIPQECIDGRLCPMSSGAPALEVEFDWTLAPQLEAIPNDAHVYVDTWKDMSFMRFDYGSFVEPIAPENLLLSELDSWKSADFVIRVVKNGALLAASKKHSVTLALPDTKTRRSLIMPHYDDLGERPWRLDVNETITLPLLVFNERWWNAGLESGIPINVDPIAMGAIMPSVLEGMLNWLLIHHVHDARRWHDDPTWKGAWFRFARGLSDTSPPLPDGDGEYDSLEQVSDWISDVVANFSESKGLTSQLMMLFGGV